jgi:ketosteroid isomerase-like protein
MAGESETTSDEIVALERAALERWGHGDPGGFLELYGADITYFDPLTAARIDGHEAMTAYYGPWKGKIFIERFEVLNPNVVVSGDMALLTYNLVNYARDVAGNEIVGSSWNSTAVFRRSGTAWKSIHSHWSFTRHSAFQEMTESESERQGA